MADYKLVGKNFTPPDLVAKVTGAAKYSEDFRAEGMLHAKLLLSPMPHARVRNIDTSAAMKMTIEETGARVTSQDLPQVMGDRIELTRVFQNLLSNALKFRSSRAPEVRVSATRSGSEWRLSIADNGIGIDPKHVDRIFAVFQRLHPIDRYQGTGIGLSVVLEFVQAHGGTVEIVDGEFPGAHFRITMPLNSPLTGGGDDVHVVDSTGAAAPGSAAKESVDAA